MRKSTLFLSAVLTTFVMAMLVGVASAYQGLTTNKTQDITARLAQAQAMSQVQTQPEIAPVADVIPAAVQPTNFTPDQAAALAAQVLGRDDLYSVEVTDLNGESVYMVTFSSGDLVYISLDGQIRSIGKVPVQTVVVSSGRGRNRDRASTPNKPNHKEPDDHKEHDGHDD